MPARRASASAGQIGPSTPSLSSSRLHRSNDSHTLVAAYPSSGLLTTPQQKVVHTLVNRLKNKLPVHSGSDICVVEADEALQDAITTLVDLSADSADIVAWALAELLDKLAKPIDLHGHRQLEVLQSQLMLLKVLCAALASRWGNDSEEANARLGPKGKGLMSSASTSSLHTLSNPSKRSRQSSYDQLFSLAQNSWTEPPPLDDNCARYVLSVMIVYLRQTAPPDVILLPYDNFNFYTSFHDFETTQYPGMPSPMQEDPFFGQGVSPESIGAPRSRTQNVIYDAIPVRTSTTPTVPLPQCFTTYEKTSQMLRSSLSMNLLIAKFVGRILYHLSASNWGVIFMRIKTKIYNLAYNPEDNQDMTDLQLMAHSLMDKTKLVQVLQELSSLLVNISAGAQVAISPPLRSAIWNWIDIFPDEYHDAPHSRGRLDGMPERVYDLLFNIKDGENAAIIWPTLTALMCCSSVERLGPDFSLNSSGIPKTTQRSKDRNFVELLTRYTGSNSKFSQIAIVCVLDFARGACRAELAGEASWYVADIAHELKTYLLHYQNKRPFWEAEEVDVGIISAALATMFRILPEEEGISLFQTCLELEQSAAVKLCVVQACIMLTIERHRLPLQRPLDNLIAATSVAIRHVFVSSVPVGRPHAAKMSSRNVRTQPKAHKPTSEMHEDTELLLFAIMTLWRADLPWHMLSISKLDVAEWTQSAQVVWGIHNDPIMKLSTARTYRSIANQVFNSKPGSPHLDGICMLLKVITPSSIIAVSHKLISDRFDFKSQQMWVGILHGLMDLYTRKTEEEYLKDLQRSEERVPAFAVCEIACLVSLTSQNTTVSLTSAHCLRMIAEAERHPDVPLNHALSEDERAKRYPVYDQLGDPNVFVVGRIAHQKRIRKLIRLVASSSPIYVTVWMECYSRCRIFGESIKNASENPSSPDVDLGLPPMTTEERHAQWQNLALFLAAFGASVTQDNYEPRALTRVIPAQYLSDQMLAARDPNKLLNEFLEHLIGLLVSDSLFTREVARDALGVELGPKLYNRVFRCLEEVIRDISQTHGDVLKWSEDFSNFLDQFIAVIKALMEHMQSLDDLLNVDIMAILLSIASFLSRFTDIACNRARVKYCAMCDIVLEKLDKLALRRDSSPRQNILDVILEWIQDPGTVADHDPNQQHEVNIAILRTSVRLMDRLQLEPLEATGEEAHRVVSRLFARYQKTGYKLLDYSYLAMDDEDPEPSSASHKFKVYQREAEICDLIIQGSAYLISSNTEIGIKHTMAYAYDPNLKKRAIFARVFSRVLKAGTSFNGPSLVPKPSSLCELVKGQELMLAIAICETCPVSEVDFIIPVLLNLFDTRALLMKLLKNIVDREVTRADSPGNIFRRNTTSVRLLSAFARIHGYNYLRGLITPLVKYMLQKPADQGGYDLDPNRAFGQDLKQNQENVELVTSAFIEIVTSSLPTFPPMLRELCGHIGKAVHDLWPESKFAAVGAFMFLRFISPAIVAPDIIDIEIPKDDDGLLRRGLMVIAKIIQSLANNIFFGKENHMKPLNDFLRGHIFNVTRFLGELVKPIPSPEDDVDEWLGFTYDDTDTIVLHRFFDKHADKVGKELLSLSKPAGEGDAWAINGKRAWDTLCSTLVELGQPMEVPQASTLSSDEHEEFQALMKRFAYRDTTPVARFFVESPPSDDQITVYVTFLSQVEADTVDMELFLYHCLKTMMASGKTNQPCDIILDMTGFASSSQLPLQWLKYMVEVIPSDVRSRVRAVHFLNVNNIAYRYLRRLHNLSAGSYSSLDAKVHASIAELSEHVPPSALVPLEVASKLEEEQVVSFKEVTMRQEQQQMKMPVRLDVGSTHIRLTLVKAQSLTASVSCRCTEIISLADISDVYNVSTGRDSYEFIIRRIRHGVTLYFSSQMRDSIIKSIRIAKGSMKNVLQIGPERYSRLSNVTAALLHTGMCSSTYEDEDLREAGYELINSVCSYLDYEGPCLVPVKGAFVSRQTNALVVQLSERLSIHAPNLTLDFLSEVALTMDKVTTIPQKIHCMQYMSPWIRNLVHFPDPTSPHYDHSGARLRDCIHTLIYWTLADEEIYPMVQQYIWSEVNRLDSVVVNQILDELMRAAVDGGIGSQRSEMLADTIGTLSSINVRGRILSRLRKVVGKTTLKPTQCLSDNIHWNEIAVLTRLVQVSGAQCKQAVQSQLFVPEIVHLVTLIASTGQTIVRQSVHGIVMNLLQTLTMGKTGEAPSEIRALLEECIEPETLRLFGLERSSVTREYISFDHSTDKLAIIAQEQLTLFLARIVEGVAGSKGLLNVWRARWMSLVSSTAFQLSPAVQSRAFVSLGVLATEDVDDDLFYQMLVAFKTAVYHSSETDSTTVVSMLRCFAKVVPALPSGSRFTPQLFWLSVALLQSSNMPYFVEAANLLRVTLEVLTEFGWLKAQGVSATLLEERAHHHLVDTMSQLDHMLGLSFQSSFSFSLAAVIFKGLRHSGLKESAANALKSLLHSTIRFKGRYEDTLGNPGKSINHEALGYFLALLPLSSTSDDFRRLLADVDADPSWYPDSGFNDDWQAPHVPLQLLGVADSKTALLVVSFICAMLVTSQGDDAETEILYGILSDVGDIYPDTISLAYDCLHAKILEAFANSSRPGIVKSVSNIFKIAIQQEPGRVVSVRGSVSTLGTVDENGLGRMHIRELEELGLQGLPNSLQFLAPNPGTKVMKWIGELVKTIVE